MIPVISHRATITLAAILLSALGAPACSSSDTTQPSSDSNAALKDWLASLAAAECAVTGPCCVKAAIPHDQAYCREVVTEAGWNDAEKALAAGATFDPTVAEQCLNALSTMDCTTQFTLPSACSAALRADAPPGASCQADVDCARSSEGSSFCAFNGTCRTVIPGGTIGSNCSSGASVTYVCGEGLTCDVIGDDTCQAEPAIGTHCLNSNDCAPDDYCDTTLPDYNAWTCRARAQLDEPCGQVECVSEAACESGTCQLKLPATAPCASNDDCQGGACDKANGRCRFFDWCTAP